MSEEMSFGNVCESISYGVTASAVSRNDGPRLLRITDLTEDGVNWNTVPGCRISRSEMEAATLQDGDIVVARTGGTVGKSFLVTNPPDSVCASYLLRLRPNTTLVLPKYLQLFMQSRSYWRQLMDAAQGAAQPNVNGTTLSAIKLPVPTIAEQKSTVSRMYDQLQPVVQARRAAHKQVKEISCLATSLVDASLQSGASTSRIGDVLHEIKEGVGDSWRAWPILGATRAGLAPAKEPAGKNAERYKPVAAGTVFYNPMRILIGSIAFVDDDDQPGITSPDYVVLKGIPGVVDSRWFYYWLRSPWGDRCIQSLARGAVRERMLFSRLAEGEIELPCYAAQVQASGALAQIKSMRTSIQKQSEELELLPQKLLEQVFGS